MAPCPPNPVGTVIWREPGLKITLVFAPSPRFSAENRWVFGSRADWQRLLYYLKIKEWVP